MGAHTAMDEVAKDGAFVRTDAGFRNFIKKDGSTQFSPEKDRYHLYVSYACPWANRCLIVRAIKGLEDVISISVVHPIMERTRPNDENDKHTGWVFKPDTEFQGNIPDTLLGVSSIREIYEKVGDTLGKYSVPILYDKQLKTIVSNESSEIIRMFGTEFNDFSPHPEIDLYPAELADEIDEVNSWVYPTINNGVYKCGFAKKQEPYDKAVNELFDSMDRVEEILKSQRYIVGKQLTEADIRLFVTLVRFDEVYHGHFKCNVKRVMDYPNMENYVRDIYQTLNIKSTINMPHIKYHYHCSHETINVYGIVPKGPGVNYDLLHDRERFGN